ncbi:expressed unknown protein [Seminavis robusta]|uniref:Uncharacterized protein n=1 Tax=Seminavis robusta TaxID=568900 RepID=A0A9N8EET1_9STRA|nr:expressed unknown protein [Seminavis robusta]|eukprot:Sro1078_g238830.1 n/a (372) ;mRNA; r:35204-36504
MAEAKLQKLHTAGVKSEQSASKLAAFVSSFRRGDAIVRLNMTRSSVARSATSATLSTNAIATSRLQNDKGTDTVAFSATSTSDNGDAAIRMVAGGPLDFGPSSITSPPPRRADAPFSPFAGRDLTLPLTMKENAANVSLRALAGRKRDYAPTAADQSYRHCATTSQSTPSTVTPVAVSVSPLDSDSLEAGISDEEMNILREWHLAHDKPNDPPLTRVKQETNHSTTKLSPSKRQKLSASICTTPIKSNRKDKSNGGETVHGNANHGDHQRQAVVKDPVFGFWYDPDDGAKQCSIHSPTVLVKKAGTTTPMAPRSMSHNAHAGMTLATSRVQQQPWQSVPLYPQERAREYWVLQASYMFQQAEQMMRYAENH